MVDTGIFLNVKLYSETRPVTVTSQPTTLFNNLKTLIPSLNFTEFRVVAKVHLQWVWHASREHLPFWTLVPFWDLLMLQLLRPVSRTCRVFYRLFTLNISRCLLDFATEQRAPKQTVNITPVEEITYYQSLLEEIKNELLHQTTDLMTSLPRQWRQQTRFQWKFFT